MNPLPTVSPLPPLRPGSTLIYFSAEQILVLRPGSGYLRRLVAAQVHRVRLTYSACTPICKFALFLLAHFTLRAQLFERTMSFDGM